jgi:hypothetical protein
MLETKPFALPSERSSSSSSSAFVGTAVDYYDDRGGRSTYDDGEPSPTTPADEVREVVEAIRAILSGRNDASSSTSSSSSPPLSMAPYIGELLDAGIPLLVYNGDRDMTTNMVGSEMVLNTRLEWHGKGEWQDAPRGMWKTDYMTKNEYTGGWAKELGGLTFVVVYNSDHASPVVGSFSRSRRHTRTYNAGNNIGM